MRTFNRKPNTTCSKCGKAIYRRPHEIERYETLFCSQDCYLAFHGKKKIEAQQCSGCETLFKPTRAESLFCSTGCANRARVGPTYSKDRFQNTTNQRLHSLKIRFDFQHCMVEGCTYNRTYDIHRHVTCEDGGKYEVGNIFAICPNHHAEITRGIVSVEKVDDSMLRIIN